MRRAVNTALFAAVLARFAATIGCTAEALRGRARQSERDRGLRAGPDRRVIPVLDGAGWHASERLTVPAGLRLEFLPPYSPELQPAERPWPLTDAALADRHFTGLAELDAALAERCLALCDQPEIVRAHTRFHWWPEAA